MIYVLIATSDTFLKLLWIFTNVMQNPTKVTKFTAPKSFRKTTREYAVPSRCSLFVWIISSSLICAAYISRIYSIPILWTDDKWQDTCSLSLTGYYCHYDIICCNNQQISEYFAISLHQPQTPFHRRGFSCWPVRSYWFVHLNSVIYYPNISLQ